MRCLTSRLSQRRLRDIPFVTHLQQVAIHKGDLGKSFEKSPFGKAIWMESEFILTPETHTFHLPTGECTITLEDVVLLLGLRVGGKAVTGSTMVSWTDDFLDLVGVMPPESQRKWNFIKLKWLREAFSMLTPESSNEEIIIHCRAYILELIGGILMPDKSHNRVHIMWLHLLRDLRETGQYSWGSTCLTTLYRELCRASEPGVMSIGGCSHLLQT
ncbi:serine/threonine-protein phosphatase 7 long form homolog [Cicer arietinum]|uniref:serine/threonine-protein phosphatase 7 long form homolog n=1 Tax=Cicer arietinum TaxID=3827 RepID=UPI003CC53936